MKETTSRRASLLALLSFAPITIANAQTSPTPDTQPIAEVVVTGSHIRSSTAEIPSGVTVITATDLDSRGFKNAFDALNNLTQNTGFTQGADFGNTFTPAASTISLRGLGPNHTLVLINGQRVTEYPIAYDGSVNFVNLA